MIRRLALVAVLLLIGPACSGDDQTVAETTTTQVTTTTVAEAGPTETLEIVRARDRLVCGHGLGIPGFADLGPRGELTGLMLDFCRAVATAVVGDAAKVDWVSLEPSEMIDVLAQGDVDLLTHFTTWTFSRDNASPVDFGPTYFFDGLGILVAAAEHQASDGLDSLQGETVCTVAGTTSEANLRSAAEHAGVVLDIRTFPDPFQIWDAFRAGECEANVGERSVLFLTRGEHFDSPEDGLVLDLVLAQEPLGPVYREGDPTWADIVNWTMYALLVAEEKGLTSENIEERVATSTDPEVLALFAGQGLSLSESMDLDREAFRRVIRVLGNYDEIFERNLAPLGVSRGLNALWRDGGLMFAPPAR
ncbi:MAG: transporter substrate-binding domain-containing protein [Acidimicrobiia bacterium]|nr:transporter substrate-binding domain-containing protein [Acidimicrobiia bacterium]